jgi:Protein of unknown function (DUF1583)
VRTRFSAWAAAILLTGLGAVPSGSAAEIGQDFRGKPYDPKLFKPTGPGFATAIQSDRQGLRIVLPPEHGKKPPVGVVIRTGVKGDFEITMEFEVVEVKEPTGGQGAGPSLYLAMESPTQEAATTGWQLKPNGSSVFFTHHASTPPGGKREHHGNTTPISSRSGKLRLVRTGSTLSYLAAEGRSDSYREIDRFEIGRDEVNTVRIAASNGGSPTLVDVRINSLKVVADELGETTPRPPPRSRWPLWLGAGAVLAAGGAYVLWRKR